MFVRGCFFLRIPRVVKKVEMELDSTRTRLLEAAGEIFAENGFAATTIQMISHRAGANIASVNYYFGSKENLYHEVLAYGRQISGEAVASEARSSADEGLQVALENFIRLYLNRLLNPDRPEWYSKLIAREIAEPTSALDELIRIKIEPMREYLSSIVRRRHGEIPEGLEQQILECIVGQCLFYYRCRHVILRMRGQSTYTQELIDEIAANITHFSLGGIASLIQAQAAKA